LKGYPIDRKERSNLMTGVAILAGLRLEQKVINQILKQDVMKGSVIYEQIFQKGEQRKKALVIKPLKRRMGLLSSEIQEQVNGLSLDRAEDLGEALLDFGGIKDLVVWLAG
jgi:predicted transposase YdaD